MKKTRKKVKILIFAYFCPFSQKIEFHSNFQKVIIVPIIDYFLPDRNMMQKSVKCFHFDKNYAPKPLLNHKKPNKTQKNQDIDHTHTN